VTFASARAHSCGLSFAQDPFSKFGQYQTPADVDHWFAVVGRVQQP
jgi:hypothetical protein